MKNVKQSPPVLAAQKERKEYHKPTFEVIDLNIRRQRHTNTQN